jgi:hypothetical protein
MDAGLCACLALCCTPFGMYSNSGTSPYLGTSHAASTKPAHGITMFMVPKRGHQGSTAAAQGRQLHSAHPYSNSMPSWHDCLVLKVVRIHCALLHHLCKASQVQETQFNTTWIRFKLPSTIAPQRASQTVWRTSVRNQQKSIRQ